jgi:hypothetical protein
MASLQKNSQGKKYNTEAFDFDMDKLPADLPAGHWKFVVDRATVGRTQKQDLKISFKMKVIEALDGSDENSVGKSTFETVVFYKDPDASGVRMMKIRLKQLVEATEFDPADVPRKINEEALETFAAALKDQEFEAWTTVRVEDSGEERTNISYNQPAGGPLPEVEEEEEKPRGKGKAARR